MRLNEKRSILGKNSSVLLDVLRFAAAIVVALSHMPLHFVQAGPIISERAGNTAVCVFFVLSGFVIRYVTVSRVTTAEGYWIDRASRIYSVVVPALLLTVILEYSAFSYAPDVYRSVTPLYPWNLVPKELAEAWTFTVGWWGAGILPVSNGPYWSLPFEVMYYVLYGLLLFTRRARWFLVPLLMLACGPSIALLFPTWLFGVVLYDVYVRLHPKRNGLTIAASALAAYVGLLWLLRTPLARALQATTVLKRRTAVTDLVNHYSLGRAIYHGDSVLWLDRLSPTYFLSGSLLAVGLLVLLLFLDHYTRPVSRGLARAVRLVADSTFTLYLFHVPFFIFVDAIAGGPLKDWRGGTAMLLAAIVISMGLAMLSDRLKDAMRGGLKRGFAAPSHPEPSLR